MCVCVCVFMSLGIVGETFETKLMRQETIYQMNFSLNWFDIPRQFSRHAHLFSLIFLLNARGH